ncbi:hypothetical protein ACJMK2_017283 [Sinanodonta woodiana]|uniref:Uncharacterized protein n=1 Tax=Sinanodonta woodiana TaxID=1069815 RepID=A0ABD3UXE9_SINWO
MKLKCLIAWRNGLKLKTNYESKKRKKEILVHEEGNGRPMLAEKYPMLATCLLSLFDSAGQGLQTHPHLICETLFINKKSWLDMPQAVSLLQVFGIPISSSAAYTYTHKTLDPKHSKQKGIMKVWL